MTLQSIETENSPFYKKYYQLKKENSRHDLEQ